MVKSCMDRPNRTGLHQRHIQMTGRIEEVAAAHVWLVTRLAERTLRFARIHFEVQHAVSDVCHLSDFTQRPALGRPWHLA